MNLHDFAVSFFQIALVGALALLCIAFLLTVIRILLGPTLPDRVLGLDVLTNVTIGFIAVIALDSGYMLYVDVAIGLSLVGFLATVAFSRFILSRGKSESPAAAPAVIDAGVIDAGSGPLPEGRST